MNSFFVFAWELCIEKWRGFLLKFFLVSVSHETKHEKSSKNSEFGAKFGAEFGTKIRKKYLAPSPLIPRPEGKKIKNIRNVHQVHDMSRECPETRQKQSQSKLLLGRDCLRALFSKQFQRGAAKFQGMLNEAISTRAATTILPNVETSPKKGVNHVVNEIQGGWNCESFRLMKMGFC